MRLDALVRAFLIGAHQARIAHHIGGEDRGKTAGGGRSGHCSGGDNFRTELNLLRAARRQFHAAPWCQRSDRTGHSSGIPALRSPAKYVASHKARIFGTPQYLARMRAMLEKEPSPASLRASASSEAGRSVSPLRA